MAVANLIPAVESGAPVEQADVAAIVRAAYETGEAVFPKGGGTALDFGGLPSRAGRTLDLSGVSKIVDYTPRDMTILVEAGMRMKDLSDTLAAEGQMLPIDVPRADVATIGGVVATNWCGSRGYGHGTIRDYVIGIHAVDGRGVPFKGGGRVVKNVAGYDFCKLLTGSLGTLGVITQLALKVKPHAEAAGVVVADCATLDIVDRAVERLLHLEAPATAIDVIGGNWGDGGSSSAPYRVFVRVEGTTAEVNWLVERVRSEILFADGTQISQLNESEAAERWDRQLNFPDRGPSAAGDDSPFVVRASVPSSAVTQMINTLRRHDPNCAIQAHAASGIVVARFAKFMQADISNVLVAKLRPAATKLGGSLVVLHCKLEGLTPHLIWGGRTDSIVLLERIKQKFDPKNILNPGRFVF